MNFLIPMWIIALILVCVGSYLVGRHSVKRCDGRLIIDDVNYENTRIIVDMDIDLNNIQNKKIIHLKVKTINEGDV